MREGRQTGIGSGERVELRAIPGLPLVGPGDDLAALIAAALARAEIALEHRDVIVIPSKVVSRAEGRFVDLTTVDPSERARALAADTGKDPRLVEVILRETQQVSRVAKGALVVRHRLGFVYGDAGVDCSNAVPPGAPQGTGPWALTLPADPDASARRIQAALDAASGVSIGVIVSDSFGRPFRVGTVGMAIGIAGVPALCDRRGDEDLFGRVLEHTITAFADQIAAAADLVAGQAAEGRGAILVRGLVFPPGDHAAAELLRPASQDLYA